MKLWKELIDRALLTRSVAWNIILYPISQNCAANCITENVTEGSIVASGKMLLSDKQKSLSEERHDEPEKQA
jgi:hypothetical protein